jgi:DNA (cytosine-5)-methyltransferase 1
MTERTISKTVAEFFAGIGLMRVGLEKSGWTISLANDIDRTKQKLYLNHFTESIDHFSLEDIHKLSANEIPTVSLATASFPCSDLSLAGRRAGLEGEHSSAFWGFVNILQDMGERKPLLILLENVAGFLPSKNGQDFHDALTALNKIGYSVDAFIIDAAHFVPQSRVRLFIVGKLIEEPLSEIRQHLPTTELRPSKLVKFIYDNPSIHWNINLKLPNLPLLKHKLEHIIESPPKTSKLWWSKERVDYLLKQTFERHLSKLLELKKANAYAYLTAFRRIRNGKSMAEIRFDGIAGCLRTPKGGSARQILLQVGKDEINIRLLTPRECAKLMGADDFKLSGTVNEAFFGFGDAVCVPVVSWISENYLNPELTNIINGNKLRLEKYAESA